MINMIIIIVFVVITLVVNIVLFLKKKLCYAKPCCWGKCSKKVLEDGEVEYVIPKFEPKCFIWVIVANSRYDKCR